MQSDIKIKFRFKCIIGILDFERKKKQELELKLRVCSQEFLDYAELIFWLKKSFKEQKFKLLEDALSYVELELKKLYPHVSYLKLRISKLRIIKHAKVGVVLEKFY